MTRKREEKKIKKKRGKMPTCHLLTEFQVRTVSYGPIFSRWFMARALRSTGKNEDP